MAIQIACASCSAALKVKDELLGKAIKCPKCGHRFKVDAAAGATLALDAAPDAPRGDPSDQTGQVPVPASSDAEATCNLAAAELPAEPAAAPEADSSSTQAFTPAPEAVREAPAGGTEFLSEPDVGQAGTEFLSQPDADAPAVQDVRKDDAEVVRAVRAAHGATELHSLGGYRIVRELGHGGMGAVYEAEDDKLKRRVAIKVMKPEIAKHQSHRERFLREARTAAKVHCDFICPIYRVGEDDGMPFIAMPLLKGQPLDRYWKQAGRLPVDEVVRIGMEVAQGLNVAHEAGLVHRDIKPANIWLETQRSGRARAVILDFGLARMQAEDVHITQSGAIIGTPAFMSPEQARGDKNVDARTDLFSLGCVLYALCTGELPFQGDTTMAVLMALASHTPVPPHKIVAEIPRPLSRLIMRLLEKNQDDRPQTAREVIEEFGTIDTTAAPAGEGQFTTQVEVPVPPDASGDLSEPSVRRAEPTMLLHQPRPPAAKPRTRPRTTTYILVSLLGLGLLGCVAPLAGIGVYFLVLAGGGGPDADAAAQGENDKDVPTEPTGVVPAGWVVVGSPMTNVTVAMPQTPATTSGNGIHVHTVLLSTGAELYFSSQPLPGPIGPGAEQLVEQRMVQLLMNSGAIRPGAKVPEAARIRVGAWLGRQIRLRPQPAGFTGGFVGLQTTNVPGGVKIQSVTLGSPAAKAGLQVNDIVIEAGGRPVNGQPDLITAIRLHTPEKEMQVKVQRGQDKLEMKVRPIPVALTETYLRMYVINNNLVTLRGPAQGDVPAPETTAFFNSLKIGGNVPLAADEANLPVHEVGQGLEQRGQLDGQTRERVYRVQLTAGTTYVIDMVTPNQPALDPFLVLTDAAGRPLAQDDDGGGGLNARIVYRALQSGTYRIVATSINFGTGAYTLTVRANAGDNKKKMKVAQ
jgi:serine/threonine protein kinase